MPVSPDVTDAALRVHPLAVWTETRLGVSWSDPDQRWVRARPLTITEAVKALSEESGRDESACRAALRSLLLISSIPERTRTGAANGSPDSFFAFKLHQFISGAGHAFSTVEPVGRRTVTVEGRGTASAVLVAGAGAHDPEPGANAPDLLADQ